MKKSDRKPRSDSRKKTRVVSFRVTPEEHARLAAAAANDGYDKSTALWAMDLAKEEAGLPGRAHRVLPDLVWEMRKVGVNINQLAHAANRAGQVDHEDRLRQSMAELTDLMLRAARSLP